MLVDLNETGSAVFESPFDVCVVGSGPAGVPLALRLAEKKHRVLLLEAGGLQYSPLSQEVYRSNNVGLDYFPGESARMRFFGGTSNHWGGWCRDLGEDDFFAYDHVEHSGWPISKADLAPYLEEAANILDIQVATAPDYLAIGHDYPNMRRTDFMFSIPATRFGHKYREQIESSENITCVLNANLVDIRLAEGGGSVTELVISDYAGKLSAAKAGFHVLCLGGIENPRALLNANKQIETGIGNQHDLVGRFFMDHPTFTLADVVVNHESPAFKRFEGHQGLMLAFYEPTTHLRREAEILNFGLRFMPGSLITQSLESRSFSERMMRNFCESDALFSVANQFSDQLDCFDAQLRISSEQSPNPSSRIMLGTEQDKFGNRRVDIDWQLTELDKRTMLRAALEAGSVLAQRDLGRVRLKEWILDSSLAFPDTTEDEVAGYHHMGTTRMADSPQQGVVNADLQVHGVDNLYVGGSSVFPTCGWVNPTLAIIQLSLRLADHLDGRAKTT